jgi:hypothetical protein
MIFRIDLIYIILYFFRVPLTSVGDMWEYGCSLLKSQRLLFLSLFSVILWIRWNERNKFIFRQQSLMLFNNFVLQVSHLFSMWMGIQFSLLFLCRLTTNVMIQDVLSGAANLDAIQD